MEYIDVIPGNVEEYGIFCIKDKKAPGYRQKVNWFKNKLNKGLRIILAINEAGKQSGFIEFIPSELAWRPIKASNYLFIHCIALFSKKDRNKAVGSHLIKLCEQEALRIGKDGVCVMTSTGPWMANSSIFKQNEYQEAERKDRFELFYKSFKNPAVKPRFTNWDKQIQNCKGWQLYYSNQCPWHFKSIEAISRVAKQNKISLKIIELQTPKQAQNGPSGYGTFALINNGTLLADHYISETRFKSILSKELKNNQS
ncbi:MAG: hypothetical protein HKN00_09555 [Flavobacteriaceae bacterium]|nr:YoaP domain-containing protein [Bacteroidia bacterium]NNF75418.1 hypothetical protein [Flavobacteriaceae bacterium]NNK72252.1 hypothetical protein [Flavobacteriaceae bacterium]